MVLQEAVGRGWRAGVSLQTSWLQEFTNQVSSPRTTASGLVGPRPLHEKSQWETAHYCLAPQRAEGLCGCGPGLSVPGALAPKSMDVVPSQPYPPKSNQEHFLRVSVIFLGGSQSGERKPQHPESNSLRGSYLHTWDHFYAFSISSLAARGFRAWAPPPSSY